MNENYIIWIIGAFVIIIIALLISNKVKVNLTSNGLNIDAQKNRQPLKNVNEIKISGELNEIEQSVNSSSSNEKHNKIDIKGNQNKINQRPTIAASSSSA